MPTAAGFKRGFNKGEMKNDALFMIGFDLLEGENRQDASWTGTKCGCSDVRPRVSAGKTVKTLFWVSYLQKGETAGEEMQIFHTPGPIKKQPIQPSGANRRLRRAGRKRRKGGWRFRRHVRTESRTGSEI